MTCEQLQNTCASDGNVNPTLFVCSSVGGLMALSLLLPTGNTPRSSGAVGVVSLGRL